MVMLLTLTIGMVDCGRIDIVCRINTIAQIQATDMLDAALPWIVSLAMISSNHLPMFMITKPPIALNQSSNLTIQNSMLAIIRYYYMISVVDFFSLCSSG